MSTGPFPAPVIAWHPASAADGDPEPGAPLIVLLHGRGSNEADIVALAPQLPVGPSYAAVRAPIGEGGGYAWFANRGIGRPVAESLAATMSWFRDWLDAVAPPDAGVRDPGGHGISPAALQALAAWRVEVLPAT